MRADRHDEAFRNLANAPIKTLPYRVNPFLLLHCRSCPQKRNDKWSPQDITPSQAGPVHNDHEVLT